MKKQTAIEWLVQYIHSEQYQKAFGQTYISIELVNQAIAMEKDQILEAYREGRTDQDSGMEKFHNRSSAMYYNQTYES